MRRKQFDEPLQIMFFVLVTGAGITGFIGMLNGDSVTLPITVCIVITLLIAAAIAHDLLVLYLLIRKPNVDGLFIVTHVRVTEALRLIPLLVFLVLALPAYWLRGKMDIHENLW